ncbi:hypothetical protein ARALYDRAFT_911845 [Arabidopsis lyrata subsp. lyrata]|uniref:PGG domain-containing protein n=1 Tax=Arabidopsis lyrata subsp. lyrata TaxID=81972 RepID=D7M2N2_ARALL|nr:hypothetical protein ARALYDRAFT_911845 [Arabidopsis lyrata subsp. lyrata]
MLWWEIRHTSQKTLGLGFCSAISRALKPLLFCCLATPKNWHPKVVSMFTWDHRGDLKIDSNGSVPNLGMATLAKKTDFRVFLVCDTLAMYSSIITIVSFSQLKSLQHRTSSSWRLHQCQQRLWLMYLAVRHLPLLGYVIMVIGDIFLLVLMLLLVPYVSPYTNTQLFLRHIF